MVPVSTSSNDNEAARLLVDAYVDDELDVARALEVKRQIDADPALAAQAANVIALRSVLRDKLRPETVSPEFRQRIRASVGTTGRSHRRPTWVALAASVLIAALVGSGVTWFALRGADRDIPLIEVADAHMRSLVAAKPFDVASSERHVVRPWFAGKLSYAPKVVDLSADGFPLAGARVDMIETDPVAALVYNRRLHVINVLSRPKPGAADAAVRLHTMKGYHVVSWTEGGVQYWAISDLNAGELQSFTELFRKSS